MKIIIILPTQLFENPIILRTVGKSDIVILYEHPMYFTNYKYHKMKLVMHRATMKMYEDYLDKYDCRIKYLSFDENLLAFVKKNSDKLEQIKIYNPIDHNIFKQFEQLATKLNVVLEILDNESYLCTMNDFKSYLLESKGKNAYIHRSFYAWCRKKFDILIDEGKPIGGKWSFDTENRLSFPEKFKEKLIFGNKKNKYLDDAKKYINTHFKSNHGDENYYLPVDFNETKKHFRKFLKERLNDFGPYEDAVSNKIIFGSHSVMSPMINIGLITPKYIIKETTKYYETHKNIKIQSVEGYIRQLFWREYCVFVYMTKNRELTNGNFFKHKNKLGKEWYTGKTQFELINDIIGKCLKYGWAHHIERLMYLGNFMLISKTDPKCVYKWFMEMFIDAYPWVMEPNIYGMTQFSAGNIMMTRPYFSSSNYINKMSTYKKKPSIYKKIKLGNESYEWYEVWDALYYNFVNDNSKYFSKNYSTANFVSNWKKKTKKEQNDLIKIARIYLKYY